MGTVIVAGGNPKMKVPVAYPDNFADATWAQIIDACQKNKVPETWVVGSQKDMTINGTAYPIDIIGKNHDTYSAGGTAPLTFQMHNCYETKYSMNPTRTNSGGWEACNMRKSVLPTILSLMPTEVKNNIREVNKLTGKGYESSTASSTADKLFLLSEYEIFSNNPNSASGEGTIYDYYRAGNSKIKNLNGSATYWAERSSPPLNYRGWCYVTLQGNADISNADSALAVSFAFCF